ncbi:hypothetical protein [Flavobacterium agrisoli]|uniref:Uncharacterized protein n=1 Tax=Flavobacterium agrisoli TaxID=2793066 RepID=A0A934UHX7_9FLAO|nr:hypothetical protein [Flavobacterium agrisoli]MBK0368237.1 hypothetical protein [Flavobacterium agrisoli]
MSNVYPLQWLDSLIMEQLNPKKGAQILLSDQELAIISENIDKESDKIQLRIKNEIFSMTRKRQIRLLVRKYHSNLIFLLDTVMEFHNHKNPSNSTRMKLFEYIVSKLDELLSFVETRFSYYLSLDERVPITYVAVSGRELNAKLNKLKTLLPSIETQTLKREMILSLLKECLNFKSRRKITFRQIIYERELLHALASSQCYCECKSVFSKLDKVLIEKNFNSVKYTEYLLSSILENLKDTVSDAEKLNVLHLFYKDLIHINCNDKINFDPMQENIKLVLTKSLLHEINYWEKKSELSSVDVAKKCAPNTTTIPSSEQKVECDLSADQLALILRAADEARIIKARSMNLVFKTIIPYLSTGFKTDLSYQSVRSKSYNAEEKDKETAIAGLEKMIKKIRSY